MSEPLDQEHGQPEPVAMTTRQPLLPLILLAVAVAGLGLYLAHTASSEPSMAREAVEIPQLTMLSMQGAPLEREGAARELRYEFPHKYTHRFVLRQLSARSSGQQESASERIEVRLAMTGALAPAGEGEEREGARFQPMLFTLERLSAMIARGDEELGSEVIGQLEELLTGARADMQQSHNGRVERFAWKSARNPQMLQVLALVEESVQLLSPHLPRQLVVPGNTWTYIVPFSGGVDASGASAEGGLTVESELLGSRMLEGVPVVVIEQRLVLVASGEGEDGTSYVASGQGRAQVAFNAEVGALVRYELLLDHELSVSAPGQEQPVIQRVRHELTRQLMLPEP